jgi:YHS domain-containing protein
MITRLASSSRLLLFILAVPLLFTASVEGQKPPVNTGSSGDLAIKGFDPVAYHDGRAVKGSAAFEYRWQDVRWWFESAANRDTFSAAPEKYAPQFGGYCAYAVSRGYTADVDPRAFRVVDGLLYLNYSFSVQRTWERDTPGNIVKGRQNWPSVLRK